jgi:N-acetylmuramoyl-L-alanine amidase
MSESNHVDVLARTLWGEARGEGRRGMEAVAAVIMNRVRDPRRWPNDPSGVAQQPWQFSSWNPGDPNLPQMQRITVDDPQFRMALEIAEAAIAGKLTDPTGGANHFHTNNVSPSWSRGVQPVAIIGRHRFFRL